MQKPTVRGALGFISLPVHTSDFSQFATQWRIVARRLADSYVRVGLVEGDISSIASLGVHGVLVLAWRGWWAKWSPSLIAGWKSGRNEGLAGCVGGLAEAVWAGRHEIVRDAAVVGMGWSMWLALWFAIAWGVLSGMVGVAHAQAAPAGTGGAASTDLARQILGDVFPFLNGSSGSSTAAALGVVASALSTVAFTLGALSMMWGLVVMVAEYTTDQDGFKQRHSWPMFIIRCAIIIPLLTPLSGGWNGGQRLVAAAAAWGSDQATKAWTAMVNQMTCTATSNNGCTVISPPMIPEADIQNTVVNTVAAEACMAAANNDPPNMDVYHVNPPPASGGGYDYGYVSTSSSGIDTTAAGGCGAVTFPTPSQGAEASSSPTTNSGIAAFISGQQVALQMLQSAVRSDMNTMAANHFAGLAAGGTQGADPPQSNAAGYVTTYRNAVQAQITAAMATVNSQAVAALTNGATSSGWIGAASWAMSISQLQGSMDTAASAMPRVTGPVIAANQPFVQSAMEWLQGGLQGGPQGQGGTPTPLTKAQLAATSGSSGILDDVFQAVMTGNGQKVFPTLNTMTPLAGIASVGRWTTGIAAGMKAAVAILADDQDASGGGAKSWAMKAAGGVVDNIPVVRNVVSGIRGAANVARDTINVIWFPLVGLGLALTYFVPALPFIRMLFGVLGWLIAFVQAVFLTPVLLVLMVSTESGGVFTAGAKACLWNVAALIARPILTVAGFVVGIMLITEMIMVLNVIWVPAIQNNAGSGPVFMAFIAGVVIYLGLAYVIVNTSTKMAEILPEAAYKWMGANAGGERDDASHVGVALGAAFSKFSLTGGGRRLGGDGKGEIGRGKGSAGA